MKKTTLRKLLDDPEIAKQIKDLLAIRGGGSVDRQIGSNLKQLAATFATIVIAGFGFLALLWIALMLAGLFCKSLG